MQEETWPSNHNQNQSSTEARRLSFQCSPSSENRNNQHETCRQVPLFISPHKFTINFRSGGWMFECLFAESFPCWNIRLKEPLLNVAFWAPRSTDPPPSLTESFFICSSFVSHQIIEISVLVPHKTHRGWSAVHWPKLYWRSSKIMQRKI